MLRAHSTTSTLPSSLRTATSNVWSVVFTSRRTRHALLHATQVRALRGGHVLTQVQVSGSEGHTGNSDRAPIAQLSNKQAERRRYLQSSAVFSTTIRRSPAVSAITRPSPLRKGERDQRSRLGDRIGITQYPRTDTQRTLTHIQTPHHPKTEPHAQPHQHTNTHSHTCTDQHTHTNRHLWWAPTTLPHR